MFREEMKKLFIKQHGVVVMVIVFIGEIILTNILYPRSDFSSDYSRSVFEEYMAEFHGELTAEKRDKFLAEQELVLNAENNIIALEAKLYRGDFTDRNKFRAEYDELNALTMRSDALKSALEKYYYALGDTGKRFVTSGNYDGLNSDYPDFLMLAAIIIITSIAFLNEENSNVSTFIRTSVNGRKSAFKFKAIALAGFIFACQLLRVISELFVMFSRGEAAELSFPIQSIEFFQNCPYDLTIAQCFLIISSMRLLGYFFIASLVMLLAVKLKTPLFTVFVPCSICLLQQFVFEPSVIAYCIPTGLLRAVGYVGGDISGSVEKNSDLIGIPFELMITVLFFAIVFIAISIIIVSKYYNCRKHTFKCKKEIVSLTIVIICCIFSGCSRSEDKSVIYNAGDNFFVVQNDKHYFVSNEDGITRVDKSDGSEFQIIRDPFLTGTGVYSMSLCGRSIYCIDTFNSKKNSVISLDTLSERTIENDSFANYSVYSVFSNGESLFFTTFDENGVYELRDNKIQKIISEKIYNNQLSFDGRRIFYINAILEMICYDTQTDEKTLLSDDFARAVYYDGSRIVFSTDKGIFTLDNNNFSAKKLLDANAQKICSDGEMVVFLNDGKLFCLNDEVIPIYDNEPLYFAILPNSGKVIMREYNQTIGQNVDIIIDLPKSSSSIS